MPKGSDRADHTEISTPDIPENQSCYSLSHPKAPRVGVPWPDW